MRKSKVPGLIYKINRDIENKLDKYEDYPKLYTKKYFRIIKKNYVLYFKKKSLIKKTYRLLFQNYERRL